MKGTSNSEKNLSTREFNLTLMNKYTIRSRKVRGGLDHVQGESSYEHSYEDSVTEYSSYSQEEEIRTSSSDDFEDEEMFKKLNLYKNRKM